MNWPISSAGNFFPTFVTQLLNQYLGHLSFEYRETHLVLEFLIIHLVFRWPKHIDILSKSYSLKFCFANQWFVQFEICFLTFEIRRIFKAAASWEMDWRHRFTLERCCPQGLDGCWGRSLHSMLGSYQNLGFAYLALNHSGIYALEEKFEIDRYCFEPVLVG